MIWGQLDYENTENKLEKFTGVERRSPVNDDLYDLYYPIGKRILKIIFSGIISFIILASLMAIVIALLIFRNWIIESQNFGPLTDYMAYLPSKENNIKIRYNKCHSDRNIYCYLQKYKYWINYIRKSRNIDKIRGFLNYQKLV
jgi:hypothetical protein